MTMDEHNEKLTRLAWIKRHVGYADEACLLWPFGRDNKGYGILTVGNGKITKAHRVMCEMVHGPAPLDRPQASHSCGNGHRGCVNPTHLSWKNNSENQMDRTRHGRHRGGKGSRATLTNDQIAEIRRMKGRESQTSLAKRFGVKPGCIQYWQSHDRQPAPPGTSRHAIWKRQQKLLRASAR